MSYACHEILSIESLYISPSTCYDSCNVETTHACTRKAREDMEHYFTREEAEALLPAITPVLEQIRDEHRAMQQVEVELGELHAQSINNGHHLHGRIASLQHRLQQHIEQQQTLLGELAGFGCVLKDPEMGLIDFLSQRAGQEIYLCWRLGEERILFWHYLDTGFAGRRPL